MHTCSLLVATIPSQIPCLHHAVVRELKIADYLFFVADKLAPILIERKTAEDVAASLHDGRWEKQKISMRKAQYVLGGGPARRCQICYIIEGDPNKRKVHGGNVGRRTYFQSLEDVEAAIEQLPKAGFSVMKSKGHLGKTWAISDYFLALSNHVQQQFC